MNEQDIVERLEARAKSRNSARFVGAGDGQTYVPAIYDRAAQSDDFEAAATIRELRSENERLRAAGFAEGMERAAVIADEYPLRDPGGDGNGYWAAEEIAAAIRAAKEVTK